MAALLMKSSKAPSAMTAIKYIVARRGLMKNDIAIAHIMDAGALIAMRSIIM